VNINAFFTLVATGVISSLFYFFHSKVSGFIGEILISDVLPIWLWLGTFTIYVSSFLYNFKNERVKGILDTGFNVGTVGVALNSGLLLLKNTYLQLFSDSGVTYFHDFGQFDLVSVLLVGIILMHYGFSALAKQLTELLINNKGSTPVPATNKSSATEP